jgi:hypothetical protein
MPAVLLRHGYELCPTPRTIDPDAMGVWTKMSPAGQAIAAMAAGDVTFCDNEIALGKSFHVIAHAIHNAHELMPDNHRHRDRFLCPRVPVIDMHVGAADGCFQHAYQHIVAAEFWNGNVFQPKPRLCFGFHNRLHRRLHDSKLGESPRRGKSFGSALPTETFPQRPVQICLAGTTQIPM